MPNTIREDGLRGLRGMIPDSCPLTVAISGVRFCVCPPGGVARYAFTGRFKEVAAYIRGYVAAWECAPGPLTREERAVTLSAIDNLKDDEDNTARRLALLRARGKLSAAAAPVDP